MVRAFRDFILTGSCHSGPGLSQGSVVEAQKVCLLYGSQEAKTEMGGGQDSDHPPPNSVKIPRNLSSHCAILLKDFALS